MVEKPMGALRQREFRVGLQGLQDPFPPSIIYDLFAILALQALTSQESRGQTLKVSLFLASICDLPSSPDKVALSSSSTWLWRPVIITFMILTLSLELTPSLAFRKPRKPSEKPGKCPHQNITCNFVEKSQCYTDFNCKKAKKCCYYSCGKKCLDPKEDLCEMVPEVGNCEDFYLRWFYSTEARACKYFFYSGCKGNVNNFPNKKICEQTCAGTVREGRCPPFPFKGITNCSATCHKDPECPETYKCCDSSCGFVCTPPWKVKPWDCPPQPSSCNTIQKPMCQNDEDCEQNEKCCSNCGLMCIEMSNGFP
ncbi:WAP four-disulfide core domain protein 8-like [Dromiciops gliroides]|uniref:WAP four-disulfide core domain protein 8-like n=1 Tax=Dromiciops gliroides TaxID=33562 RepID=UPI001CC6F392|nr:WAP four-disulfide core domain protein 8-like [Dromiciops gliroides]